MTDALKKAHSNSNKIIAQFMAENAEPLRFAVPGPKIDANALIYPDHILICDPLRTSTAAIKMMAKNLSPKGTAAQHQRELASMGNDGRWSVYEKAQIATSRVSWLRRRARSIASFYALEKSAAHRTLAVQEAFNDWLLLNGLCR